MTRAEDRRLEGAETAAAAPVLPEPSWALWSRQLAAIVRLELRRSFVGRRAVLVYLLGLLPAGLMLGFSLAPLSWRNSPEIGFATRTFAGVFQTFTLRFALYFGCVWLFTNLFRGELLERSLHYAFLVPVRRQLLVIGKFAAALLGSVALFGGSVAVSYLSLYAPYGLRFARQHLLHGPGLGQLLAYLGVTALACVGYGAVFLLVGLFFRNPILPAAAILLWESFNFLLPPLLKKLSVIHYLRGLLPLPLKEGPFAIVTPPPPVWLSVAGLLGVTAVVLVLAGRRAERLEILYQD